MLGKWFSLLQEVLVWLTKLQKELGGEVTDDQLRDFIWNTLKSGQVSKSLKRFGIFFS